MPLAVLIILGLAFGFRWETEAQKSFSDGVTKWRRDRWTGTLWLYAYTIGKEINAVAFDQQEVESWATAYAASKLADHLLEHPSTSADNLQWIWDNAHKEYMEWWDNKGRQAHNRTLKAERDRLTKAWYGLVAINVLWLLWTLRRTGET